MTIEQLEKANEISEKIKTLKEFQKTADSGIISCVEYENKANSNTVETHILHLDISEHKNISAMISKYIFNRIKELEKQLEEL